MTHFDSRTSNKKTTRDYGCRRPLISSGGDRSASYDHRVLFDRASDATAGFDGGDSDDGDAGTKTRDDEFGRRAWRSTDGRRDLASRALASTVPYRFA
jgi:hypothetical protein